MDISTQQRRINRGALLLLALSFCGCATMGPADGHLHLANHLNIYEPYDNSRDWGPGYLVGPPGHHFGYGSRIDDTRTIEPPAPDPPTPANPPDTAAPIPALP